MKSSLANLQVLTYLWYYGGRIKSLAWHDRHIWSEASKVVGYLVLPRIVSRGIFDVASTATTQGGNKTAIPQEISALTIKWQRHPSLHYMLERWCRNFVFIYHSNSGTGRNSCNLYYAPYHRDNFETGQIRPNIFAKLSNNIRNAA